MSSVVQLATQAVQADSAGDAERAAGLYAQAASAIEASGGGDAALLAKAREYRERGLALRGSAASLPSVPPRAAAPATGRGAAAEPGAGAAKGMAGTVAAGALVGGALLGPLGLLAGAGAMGAAAMRDDNIGATARKAGTATADAGSAISSFNEEHQITSRVGAAASSGLTQARQIDEKYAVTETVGGAASSLWGAVSKGVSAVSGGKAPK